MTGPEHFREAERIIHEAECGPYDDIVVAAMALAQVHAELAKVAAMVLPADWSNGAL